MKHTLSILSLTGLLFTTSADVSAQNYNNSHYQDYARVTHVEPIYNRVQYRPRDCDNNNSYRYNRNRGNNAQNRYFSEQTSTIVAAIAGGVIGNQFGGGNGKTAMTIAGTVLGGSVAREQYRHRTPIPRDRPHYRDQDRCDNYGYSGYQNTRNIEAYRVSYRYNGQTFTTTMAHDPGNRIPVDVTVRPSQNTHNRNRNW